MHRKPLVTIAAVGGIALAALALPGRPAPAPALAGTYAVPAAATDPAVARGEYLVTVMMCNDCHTPWAMTPRGPGPVAGGGQHDEHGVGRSVGRELHRQPHA